MKIKLYQCGGEQAKYSEYPLGLGYLITNCMDAEIEIVKSQKDLKNCDYIGLSSNSWGLKEAVDIVYNTNIPVILGGEGVLWEGINKYPFQHIVYGDGEPSLQKIIDGTDKRILCNRIENIDTLKFPERGKCGHRVPILTSRGCPFNCSYCSSSAFWGKVRYHSAEYFIEEVKYILSRYKNVKVLRLMDDLFIGHKPRFRQIYEMWMQLGFNKKVKVRGFMRTDLFTEEIAMKIKKMGVRRVRLGIESGSNRILNKVLNKHITVESHQKAINLCKKYGIECSGSFMYDVPGETKHDKELTQKFIDKNKDKLKIEGMFKFRPFPGTKLYDGSNPLSAEMRFRDFNKKGKKK